MASNRIIADTVNKQLAKQVAVAVDRLLDSRAEITRVLKELNASSNGSDWAALAAELGLIAIGSYTAAAQAQDLVSIWTGVDNVLNGTSYVNGPTASSATLNELARVDQG